MPHTPVAGGRQYNAPFLTQLAQGNTREHLDRGGGREVDQCFALDNGPRVHQTGWKWKEGSPVLLEFQSRGCGSR